DLGMISVPTNWEKQVVKRGLTAALVELLGSCVAPQAEERPSSAVVLAQQLAAPSGQNDKAEEEQRRQEAEERRLRGSVVQPSSKVSREAAPQPSPKPPPLAQRKPGSLFTLPIPPFEPAPPPNGLPRLLVLRFPAYEPPAPSGKGPRFVS